MIHHVCLIVGLFLAPAPAGAEDTYTIKIKETAKGDVENISDENTEDVAITIKDAGGKVLNEVKQKEPGPQKNREETLDREPKHNAPNPRRTYEKARVTADGKTVDLPYQGKTVLIEKKDGKYIYTIEGGKEITGDDAKYLNK